MLKSDKRKITNSDIYNIKKVLKDDILKLQNNNVMINLDQNVAPKLAPNRWLLIFKNYFLMVGDFIFLSKYN